MKDLLSKFKSRKFLLAIVAAIACLIVAFSGEDVDPATVVTSLDVIKAHAGKWSGLVGLVITVIGYQVAEAKVDASRRPEGDVPNEGKLRG